MAICKWCNSQYRSTWSGPTGRGFCSGGCELKYRNEKERRTDR